MTGLNQLSIARLEGVHPDLFKVVELAAKRSDLPFVVTEGVRTMDRQRKLVEIGASKTLDSRHVPENNICRMSCAVDIAAFVDMNSNGKADNGELRWDWPLYSRLAEAMKSAAKDLGIPIEWGGDWKSFKDGPHFQLPKKSYP